MVERYSLEQAQEEAAKMQQMMKDKSWWSYGDAERAIEYEKLSKTSEQGRNLEYFGIQYDRGTPEDLGFVDNFVHRLQEKNPELADEFYSKVYPRLTTMWIEKIRDRLVGEPSEKDIESAFELIGHMVRKGEVGLNRAKAPNPDFLIPLLRFDAQTSEAWGSIARAIRFFREAGEEEKAKKLEEFIEEQEKFTYPYIEDENRPPIDERIKMVRAAVESFLSAVEATPENNTDVRGLVNRALEYFD